MMFRLISHFYVKASISFKTLFIKKFLAKSKEMFNNAQGKSKKLASESKMKVVVDCQKEI